ncbi:MAG: SDR family oxidoreductase [Proteobacteria bacterium]|nr:SDR family oxidoreductase [Pseudomonadota bacterium]
MRSAGSRTAVVTGASSGIGRALAVRMGQEGWRVTGTARDVERARSLDWPSGVDIAELDLSRAESIGGFIDVLNDQMAPDVLVNNAGALEFGAVEDYDQAEVESLFHVNVLGPMQLTTALVPAFRERGSGVIVNISSLTGIMLFPFYGVYGGTKHALEALSETLWYELRPFGVRVKLVQPGFVDTPIWDKGGADLASIDPSSPYGRLQARMVRLEQRTGRRESCEKAADLIWRALNDDSHRFRYPICGARPLALARRLLGPDLQMRLL